MRSQGLPRLRLRDPSVAIRRLSARARSTISISVIALAAVAAVIGATTLYMRAEVIDSGAFADHAVTSIQKPAVSEVVAREIVVQGFERVTPDIRAARPILQSAVATLLRSEQIAGLVRAAANHGHRLLFNRGKANAAFDVADAGTVAASALRTVAPNIARRIPPQTDAVLLSLKKRSFAAETLRIAEHVRLLGILLPILALALIALGIFVAPDRRRAITHLGVAIGVASIVAAVAFELTRLYVTSHVYGTAELTNASVRAAVGGIWDAYFGELMTLTWGVCILAWVVAASSSSVLSPYSGWAALRRGSALVRRPVGPRGRAARGALILAVGLAVLAGPTVALTALMVIVGAILVYVGVGEVLTAVGPAPPKVRRSRSRRRAIAVAAATGTAALVAATVVGLSWATPKTRARTSTTCNGYAQLCNRRLDQVTLAGTHNSMSATDSPGWYIANQNRPVARQLQDGIRAFKISTHYGIGDTAGHVRTDIKAAGSRLNRVSEKLTPQARAALQRLGKALQLGPVTGKSDIWLCHTLCELGATRMVDFLTTIRSFLDMNPGQVIVFFDEDYVAEADLQNAFKRAGLFSHLATLVPGKPLPTLGELIRSGRNVLVFAQEAPSGRFAWNMNAFSWIHDTPLGAVKPSQFSCRLYRGRASNPILMMNNWADIFPPRQSPNVQLVSRRFLLNRAKQCRSRWRRNPNLILTDYYDRGDVVGAVNELNGLGNQRPAGTIAPGQG
jgi:hypothetical protein